MMSLSSVESFQVPEHIPADLIVPLPFARGKTTARVPHEEIDPMSSGPDIFFVPGWPTPAGTWVVRRPELWRQVVMQTAQVTTAGFTPFAQLSGGRWKMIPIEIDPPLHNKYRLILNPLLSPKAMAALEEKITGYARQDVLTFKDRGRCEFMKEFAFEFPIRIFLELMGLPLNQTAQFLKWEHGLLYPGSVEEMRENVLAIVDYLNSQIAARCNAPGEDFIGHIMRAEIDGRKLHDDELLGIFFTLFAGGLDTVSVHLAFMIRYLAEHADRQAELRGDPELIPGAVEELLRYFGTAGSLRTCTQDMQIAGVKIRAGDKLTIIPFLAGRNAAEFLDPQEVRFDRHPKHLAFGYGPHVCIGMHLARREIRAAVVAMLELLPTFRVEPDAEILSEMSGMLQPRSLPLVWDI